MSLLLRYAAPADHFNEALPVGNGRLGAMVFGRTHDERMILNEDSCWAGGPRNRINPANAGALDEMRRLLFAGKYAEADAVGRERFLGVPSTIDSYGPMGELEMRVGWRAPVTDYRRWLDLDGAVVVCEWREGETHHRRTVFASAPDQVLVVRHEILSGDAPRLSVRLRREGPLTSNAAVDGDLLLTGNAYGSSSRYDCAPSTVAPSGTGVALAIRLRALLDGGRQVALADRIAIDGARAATFLIAMATGARESDPAAACDRVLDASASLSYDEQLARHQTDYRELFRRFQIDLGEQKDDERTIIDRLAALRAGENDAGLIALAVQHRRYLLIAASRPGSLPSTLQGIWTEQHAGPWNCDYHFNINLQMNYWLAEPTGLGECVEPLIDWLESIVPMGERTARELYGCRGWTLHHLSDPWGATEPLDGPWGIWPWGGVWMMLHLHDHWRYSHDAAALERVWPLMRGAVRFVLDFLIDGPPGTPHAGRLTTCPSHSPENGFLTPDGSAAKFTYGATMDFGLCRALFAACLEMLDEPGCHRSRYAETSAATTLEDTGLGVPRPVAPERAEEIVDAALRAEILAAAERLPPLAISTRTGGIQEWAEDYVEADPGHRHVSPLFDLHPGVGISLHRTPALAAAAAATLHRKAAHQPDNSDGQPGWTLNWIACFWARLGDGDAALARLTRLLTHISTPNLFTFAHEQPQVADACGTAAAVCEMLVQDHDGVVRLLPALPAAWRNGNVKGLRLRGGVTLDLRWQDGVLVEAVFVASRETRLQVALPDGYQLNGTASSDDADMTTITMHANEKVRLERRL